MPLSAWPTTIHRRSDIRKSSKLDEMTGEEEGILREVTVGGPIAGDGEEETKREQAQPPNVANSWQAPTSLNKGARAAKQ